MLRNRGSNAWNVEGDLLRWVDVRVRAGPRGAKKLVNIRATFVGEEAAVIPRSIRKNEDVLAHDSPRTPYFNGLLEGTTNDCAATARHFADHPPDLTV